MNEDQVLKLSFVQFEEPCCKRAMDYVQETVNAIDLKGFPLPFEIRWFRRPDHAISVHISLSGLNERATHEPASINGGFAVPCNPDSLSHLVDRIRRELHALLMHELDEQFLFNGARIFDPHRHEMVSMKIEF